MTLLTSNRKMPAKQGEISRRVVEMHLFPIVWYVAGGAILSQLPLVRVVLAMAGKTILRGVFQVRIQVAILASNANMLAY